MPPFCMRVQSRRIVSVAGYTRDVMSSTLRLLQRLWLEILDETKRKKAALDAQRKEAAQQAAKERQSTASLDPSNRVHHFVVFNLLHHVRVFIRTVCVYVHVHVQRCVRMCPRA